MSSNRANSIFGEQINPGIRNREQEGQLFSLVLKSFLGYLAIKNVLKVQVWVFYHPTLLIIIRNDKELTSDTSVCEIKIQCDQNSNSVPPPQGDRKCHEGTAELWQLHKSFKARDIQKPLPVSLSQFSCSVVVSLSITARADSASLPVSDQIRLDLPYKWIPAL